MEGVFGSLTVRDQLVCTCGRAFRLANHSRAFDLKVWMGFSIRKQLESRRWQVWAGVLVRKLLVCRCGRGFLSRAAGSQVRKRVLVSEPNHVSFSANTKRFTVQIEKCLSWENECSGTVSPKIPANV
ncbi:hypothetical protein AVEN_13843-1 [Araneus ventricosus]|uniref:Uncharacterized protein n=1 Tax=Araneus ventricosus TaxID=182803 RepID=A0A4Y2LJ78_ARAVE|nr:hypothetical protein AVEN_13843-1 [Araneus ventricosus]